MRKQRTRRAAGCIVALVVLTASFTAVGRIGASTLSFSTYAGGTDEDDGIAIAVNDSGDVYVAGATKSADFPIRGGLQTSLAGATDMVLTKHDRNGVLLYATFLGGAGVDVADGVAVDRAGEVIVSGVTTSSDFPTRNAAQPVIAAGGDAFIVKLDATGSSLVYATYWGGASADYATGVATDASGSALIAGVTESSDFPTVNPVFGSSLGGERDCFVLELDSAGAPVHATFLGGAGWDSCSAIAADAAGDAWVTGYTTSAAFPLEQPLQSSYRGSDDAFVSKIEAHGARVGFSTYLGGTGVDRGLSIAVGAAGEVVVAGETDSLDFPTTFPSPSLAGGFDAFAAKLLPSGEALAWSRYVGGSSADLFSSIAATCDGGVVAGGITITADYPVSDPVQAFAGSTDIVITELDPAGTIRFSTYFGGTNNDYQTAVAVDAAGSIVATGESHSADFPVLNAEQPGFGGGVGPGAEDAVVFRIDRGGTAPVPGRVGNTLAVVRDRAAARLVFRWADVPVGTTYRLRDEVVKWGPYATLAGTATTGSAPGLALAWPSANLLFYRVAAEVCGVEGP